MRIQNAFRLGLFGGLGVIIAIAIGGAIGSLATILTYVGAALFLALGVDPLVSWLEKHGWKRGLAILVVLIGILAVVAAFVLAIIPVIAEQVGNLIETAPDLFEQLVNQRGLEGWWNQTLPWLPFDEVVTNVTAFFNDNLGAITAGALTTVLGIASGAFGAIIVLILMLYFVGSLASIKRGLYQLVAASKREKFIDISEQITDSVGRYVVGQVTMGLINGVLSIIVLTIIGFIVGDPIEYAALLAFVAGLFSLIPLIGTITGTVIISLAVLAFDGTPAVFWVAGWYLIYMQVEAYVISPNVMNRAVEVPGVVVVLAALIGGTLLGVLGALIAVPVAAAILLIVKQVLIPQQNEL